MNVVDLKIPIVLVVEDNIDHQELILEALEEADISEDVVVKSDGEKAWDFLKETLNLNRNSTSDNLPKIILLDLNLPKLNGLELLKLINVTKVIAVGEKSKIQLGQMGIDAAIVRHPANGGATKFREQIVQVIKSKG